MISQLKERMGVIIFLAFTFAATWIAVAIENRQRAPLASFINQNVVKTFDINPDDEYDRALMAEEAARR